MTLRQTIIDDSVSIFCNEEEFAESVVHRSSIGTLTPISAVVMRDGASTDSRGEESESFEVHVAVSQLAAVTPSVDKLSFPKRVGESATYQTVVRIISHDEGMWILECR